MTGSTSMVIYDLGTWPEWAPWPFSRDPAAGIVAFLTQRVGVGALLAPKIGPDWVLNDGILWWTP